MKPLKVVFMGSPDFAVPSLQKLHKSEHQIVAVVSGPDKRRSRRGDPVPTPVKKYALDHNLQTIDVDDLKGKEIETRLREFEADLFVVVAFKILPKNLLELPKIGSINLHASLLPKYRGAAPIHWAVINGEKETGCTVFFLDENIDTGNIISQVQTSISPDETTGDIYNRLKTLGADLIVESVGQIASNSVSLKKQNDEKASPAPKLFNENTKLDFTRSAQEVHNKIRGLNPFPTAWCMYDGKKMNIYRSEMGPQKKLAAGELCRVEEKLLVGCGEGTISLLEIQLPGTKRLSASEFSNGYDLSIKLE